MFNSCFKTTICLSPYNFQHEIKQIFRLDTTFLLFFCEDYLTWLLLDAMTGFDCEFTTTGNTEKVIFDYWDHMNK